MRFQQLALIAALLSPTIALAHTPLCSCYDSGDGTVLCEGGFSDGSSATGVEIKVINDSGELVVKGKMNEDSEFEFDKPKSAYHVEFNAGPGHLISIDSENIVE
ncbi:hypothetical protein L4D00_19450 [Photobacterium swingsii]|uniref:Carboxypeptidase regulatory-like domain-containing protein n=1 Tax=Photobacterium swingsii TaxID=680026 RepID=A0A0J8V9F2_9GAMM|nr:hypothetical protein [Photobacterium swingsii]KMV30058.1 hypothetical protein AB733_14140 [Photobacterium swingsii]PSW22983.1 hypothetical protein C9I94_17540 [Photobacterium swingsii]